MPLVKLDIPAGIYNHGNELDSKGRWLDSSLVRWTNNAAQPVGGWAHFADLENLITNGDFKSSTGWTISTSDGTLTQNTTDGTITFDIGGQEGGVYGNVFRNEFSALEADTDYFVEITFSSLTTGQVLPRLNGESGTAITASEVDGVTRVIQKINT